MRRISVTFEEEMYEQLKLIAEKKGDSLGGTVRDLVQHALNGELTRNNVDFVSEIIREQLRDILKPQVDRLAALNAKTCVQAGAAAYLTAETIAKFVPENLQEELTETYERARKKAVIYTQSHGDLT